MTEATFARPNSNTYWVLPGRLLAGEYPGAPRPQQAREKLHRFLDCGIDSFLDLTEDHELEPYARILAELGEERGQAVKHRRLTIRDMGIPDTPAHMQVILAQIEDWLAADRRVYVHCWGGIGRTGTVIGCYLAHTGLTGAPALHRMAELWLEMSESKRRRYPYSPQTVEQQDYVMHWPAPQPRSV
jgi:protein-tyrosine phosphatase